MEKGDFRVRSHDPVLRPLIYLIQFLDSSWICERQFFVYWITIDHFPTLVLAN